MHKTTGYRCYATFRLMHRLKV